MASLMAIVTFTCIYYYYKLYTPTSHTSEHQENTHTHTASPTRIHTHKQLLLLYLITSSFYLCFSINLTSAKHVISQHLVTSLLLPKRNNSEYEAGFLFMALLCSCSAVHQLLRWGYKAAAGCDDSGSFCVWRLHRRSGQ